MNSKFKKVFSRIVCAGLFALFAVPSFHAGKIDTLLRLYCLQTDPSCWKNSLSVSDRIIGNPEEPHIEIVLDGRGERYSKSDTERMKQTIGEWADMGCKYDDWSANWGFPKQKNAQDFLVNCLGRNASGVSYKNEILAHKGRPEIQCAIRDGKDTNIGILIINTAQCAEKPIIGTRVKNTMEEINNTEDLVEILKFSIFIVPEYRGKKIGSNIIKMFIESIEQKKKEDENIKYRFAVTEGNTASMRMLENVSSSLGDKFTTTDERKYDQDHWVHLIMISAKS